MNFNSSLIFLLHHIIITWKIFHICHTRYSSTDIISLHIGWVHSVNAIYDLTSCIQMPVLLCIDPLHFTLIHILSTSFISVFRSSNTRCNPLPRSTFVPGRFVSYQSSEWASLPPSFKDNLEAIVSSWRPMADTYSVADCKGKLTG